MTSSVFFLNIPSLFISTRSMPCILERWMHFLHRASRVPVAEEYLLGPLVLNDPTTGRFRASSELFTHSRRKKG